MQFTACFLICTICCWQSYFGLIVSYYWISIFKVEIILLLFAVTPKLWDLTSGVYGYFDKKTTMSSNSNKIIDSIYFYFECQIFGFYFNSCFNYNLFGRLNVVRQTGGPSRFIFIIKSTYPACLSCFK